MRLNSKQNLIELRHALENAFSKVQKEQGVTLQLGTIRYALDGSRCTARLTAQSNDKPQTSSNAMERDAYKKHCESYGLPKNALDKEIHDDGRVLRIIGLSRRSTTRPVLLKDMRDGQIWKYTAEGVQQALGIKADALLNGKPGIVSAEFILPIHGNAATLAIHHRGPMPSKIVRALSVIGFERENMGDVPESERAPAETGFSKRGSGLFGDWSKTEKRQNFAAARAVMKANGITRIPTHRLTLEECL